MANEITVAQTTETGFAAKVTLENGDLKRERKLIAKSYTQATKGSSSHLQSIPTTAAGTALTVTNLSTLGMGFFKNTDANNYVEIGIQTGGVFYVLIKLKPGAECWIHLGTNTPYARANTAAVLLEHEIWED